MSVLISQRPEHASHGSNTFVGPALSWVNNGRRETLLLLHHLVAAVSEVFAAAVSFTVEGDSARAAASDGELAAGGIAGRCVF